MANILKKDVDALRNRLLLVNARNITAGHDLVESAFRAYLSEQGRAHTYIDIRNLPETRWASATLAAKKAVSDLAMRDETLSHILTNYDRPHLPIKISLDENGQFLRSIRGEDAIVCFHSDAWTALSKQYRNVVGVLTDLYGYHKEQLDPRLYALCVPTTWLASRIRRENPWIADWERAHGRQYLRVVGLPLHPLVEKKVEADNLRRKRALMPAQEKNEPIHVLVKSGGAGTNSEEILKILKDFAPDIKAGRIRLHIHAGAYQPLAKKIESSVKKLGLSGCKFLSIAKYGTIAEAVKAYPKAAAWADVLVSKPSEQLMNSRAGIPVLMLEPRGWGKHEPNNAYWAKNMGIADFFAQENMSYRERFWRLHNEGKLLRMHERAASTYSGPSACGKIMDVANEVARIR